MNVHLPPGAVLAVLVVLVLLLAVWRVSVRRARRIAVAGRNTARLVTLSGRVLVAAGLLGCVQWVLLAHPVNPTLTGVALVVPDVVAAFVLVRSVSVSTVEPPQRRAGRVPRERGERR